MCNCGCNTCKTKSTLLVLNESVAPKEILSEGLKYHIDNNRPLTDHLYRAGSESYFNLIAEARSLYSRGIIDVVGDDLEMLTETDLGHFGMFEGKKVPLDFPIELNEAEIDYEKEKTWGIQDKFPIEVTVKKGWSGNYYTIEPKPMDISYDAFMDLGSNRDVSYTSYDYTTGEAQWTSDSLKQIKQWEEDNQDKIKVIYPNNLNESKTPTQYGVLKDKIKVGVREALQEAKKKKKKGKNANKPIGKPMRSSSGGKAYKVYVKDPKTKKVKTVRFGSGGLRAKINDKKARTAFAARHKCSQKKDRTKAGYWSCRLPRYAKLLGLKSSFSGFW